MRLLLLVCCGDAGSPCEHPGHQGTGKPITSFFLKRTQGIGPQDSCPVDGGLTLP